MTVGVTVVSEVILLVFYSVISNITEAQCSKESSTLSAGAQALVIVGGLGATALAGAIVGLLLLFFLWIPRISSPQRGVLILPTGPTTHL